jgi:hypothetical protein
MSENPYAPPRAAVGLAPVESLVPDAILKKIRNAWVAGLISAGITLVFTLLAVSGTRLIGFGAWQLLDVALILALAFGIYRKSRVCAIVMFVYFVASKIMLISQTGNASGIVMALIFLYYYALGIQGTFAYHNHIKR